MKFFEDLVKQEIKQDKIVCGDAFLSERTPESTVFALCDGIGSGVYANIAAITCANRLIELSRSGASLQSVCRMVADSMHRARREEFPFSAFSMAKIFKDGQFTVYTYESPDPILIMDGTATALKPTFHTSEFENVGEASGLLHLGDSLVLFSDGVSQAGLGQGYSFGIGTEGVAKHINRILEHNIEIQDLPGEILEMSSRLCNGVFVDDTTVAVLNCRKASQLTILTGPPAYKSKDREFVSRFMRKPGIRVVCGSTTADILARELKRKVELIRTGSSYGSPPEYAVKGVNMVTEGAIMLNQVYNILEEDPDEFVDNSVVQRLCALMREADIITFMIGNAINDAHTSMVFKQVGIRPRYAAIKLIAAKLREMGKLVVEEHY